MLHADRTSVHIDGAQLLPATSIALQAGRAVAVRGPNGAGKTTLLRVLTGRLRPSAGESTLFGERIDERDPAVRRHIAALIEPPTLYPDLTLRDHIALISAAWSGSQTGGGRGASGARTRSGAHATAAPRWSGLGDSALEAFGIGSLADRFPNELSSGQRQLVSLAVTLARPCSVLLLDEPEQRLDPDRRGIVAEVLRAARAAGVALAFASHDPELVARVADAEVLVGAASE